jgi:hypothetical protein
MLLMGIALLGYAASIPPYTDEALLMDVTWRFFGSPTSPRP